MKRPAGTPKLPESAQRAQTAATASREKVRQVVPVRAARQSQRPVEKSGRRRTGA